MEMQNGEGWKSYDCRIFASKLMPRASAASILLGVVSGDGLPPGELHSETQGHFLGDNPQRTVAAFLADGPASPSGGSVSRTIHP